MPEPQVAIGSTMIALTFFEGTAGLIGGLVLSFGVHLRLNWGIGFKSHPLNDVISTLSKSCVLLGILIVSGAAYEWLTLAAHDRGLDMSSILWPALNIALWFEQFEAEVDW